MSVVREKITPWLFVGPALLLMTMFLVWPTIQTVRFSLYEGTILNPTHEFVGLNNFVRLLTKDKGFQQAVTNTVLWLILLPACTIGFGLMVAVLTDRRRYGVFLKSIIYLPTILSGTAAAVIFRYFYNTDPNLGTVNAFLSTIIRNFEPVPWLGRTTVVNYALIGSGVWIATGTAMVILAAAYRSLPTELLEAAVIDGATPWQTFWRVSVPMMMPTIIFLATVKIIAALKLLDLILVMTGGGPRGTSRTVGYAVYWELFNTGRPGYASAVAVILLILVIPIISFYVWLNRSSGRYY